MLSSSAASSASSLDTPPPPYSPLASVGKGREGGGREGREGVLVEVGTSSRWRVREEVVRRVQTPENVSESSQFIGSLPRRKDDEVMDVVGRRRDGGSMRMSPPRKDMEERRDGDERRRKASGEMDVEELQRLWDAHAAIAGDLLRSLARDVEEEEEDDVSNDVERADSRISVCEDDDDGSSVYRDAKETLALNRFSMLSITSSASITPDLELDEPSSQLDPDLDLGETRLQRDPGLDLDETPIQREPITSPVFRNPDVGASSSTSALLADPADFDFDIEFDYFGRRFSRMLGFATEGWRRREEPYEETSEEEEEETWKEEEGARKARHRVTLLESEIRMLREAVEVLVAEREGKVTEETRVDVVDAGVDEVPLVSHVVEPSPTLSSASPSEFASFQEEVSRDGPVEPVRRERKEKRKGKRKVRREERRWEGERRGVWMRREDVEELEEEARWGRRVVGGVRGWSSAPMP